MKNQGTDKKNSPYYQKKAVLISISGKMRTLRAARKKRAKTTQEADFWSTRTINQMLMLVLYNKNDDQIFNTFNQWKKEGATVKKGSKAIFIWGQPTKASKEKENPKKGEKAEIEEFEFFPLCYLISSKDVILPEIQTEPEAEPVVPEHQEQEEVYTL